MKKRNALLVLLVAVFGGFFFSATEAGAWHTFYGSSNDDYSQGITTDGSGNVYVTGYSFATWNGPAGESPLHAHTGYFDIFVLKLDNRGAYQWHTFYGSSDYDFGTGIATDGNGNFYVTGVSGSWNGPAGESPLHAYTAGDIFVLKLDSTGTYQWHTFYGSGDFDQAYGIAMDKSGNVYVTGYSFATWNGPAGESPLHVHTAGYSDIFVLKLDSRGAYQWHTFYGSSDADISYGIATDGSGNVYITGDSIATWGGPAGESPLHAHSGTGYDEIFVLKLDSTGAYQWHTFYGATDDDYSTGIATDGAGNAYVTGGSYTSWNGPAGESPLHAHTAGYSDIFVLKLDSRGAYQWHTFYGSSSWDDGNGIAADGSGNVYVTGDSYTSWNGPSGESPLHAHTGYFDIFVLKLDSTGAYQWHTFYGSGIDDYYGLVNDDYGYRIATDGAGNAYVTGWSDATWSGPSRQSPLHAHTGGRSLDIFVLKLSQASSGSDFDADGSTDVAAFHLPSDQFFIDYSGSMGQYGWGGSDCYPLIWDYDGNGTADISVYHIPTSQWFVRGYPGDNLGQFGWGGNETIPVPGDYDGDGVIERAFYHWPTNRWFVEGQGPIEWGWNGAECIPVPGDYDGDGKTDMMIYHITTNQWLMFGVGNLGQFGWGGSDSIPVPADYDGDGVMEIAVYHVPTNQWLIKGYPGENAGQFGWGGLASFPIPGDYNGDGMAERAFYRPAENRWFIEGQPEFVWGSGGADFIPITSQMAIYNWFRFLLGMFQ